MEEIYYFVAMYIWLNITLALFVRVAFTNNEFPKILSLVIIIILPLTVCSPIIKYLLKKGQGALTMINNFKNYTRKFLSTKVDKGAIRLINVLDKLRGA